MSDTIEEVIDFILKEIINIDFKWAMFGKLFREERDHYDIFRSDDAIQALFSVLQELLINDTVLALVRLADPSQTWRSGNASFEFIFNEYTTGGKDIDQLKKCKDKFVKSCAKLKVIRNKRISHNDVNAAIHKVLSLDELTLSEIDEALNQAKTLLNAISDKPIVWSHFPLYLGPAVVLNMLHKQVEQETHI